MVPSEHARRAALHQLGGVLLILLFFGNEGDDLTSREVECLPYKVGFKVCMYTFSSKNIGNIALHNVRYCKICLDTMGYLMQTALIPFGVVPPE